jgi:hypothetical protein
MKRVSGKKETRAAQWRAHVEAWRGSGLSQVSYCRDHGISQSSLKYWNRRLNIAPQPLTLPSIVEIAPVTALRAFQSEPAPLTLRIAGRYQLDIRDDFPSLVLEKVVRTLERL